MTSPKRAKKAALPVTKIPVVKELMERLGFQRASRKDEEAFTDKTHAWRKAFKTSSGNSGPDLLLWGTSDVQFDLTEMAEKFLQDDNNADRFWSPTRSWNDDSDLQYPDDRARIIELLKQLFWRQNRYAANNSAYGYKASDSKGGTRDTGNAPSSKKSHTQPGLLRLKLGNHQQTQTGTAPEPLRPESRTVNSKIQDTTKDDVFEGPDDEPEIIKVTTKPSTSPLNKGLKHPRDRSTASRAGPSPRKRSKPSIIKPSIINGAPRRTERKPIPRNDPGVLYEGDIREFESLFEEQDSSETTTDDEETRNMPGTFTRSPEPESSKAPSNQISKPYVAPVAPMIGATGSKNADFSTFRTSPFTPQPPSPPRHQNFTGRRIISISERRPCVSDDDSDSETHGFRTVEMPHRSDTNTPPTKKMQPPPKVPTLDSTSTFDHVSRSEPRISTEENNEEREPPADVHSDVRDSHREETKSDARAAEVSRVSFPAASTPTIDRTPDVGSTPQPETSRKSTPAENPTSKPRAKTSIPLWIITHTQGPNGLRLTEERWDGGKFLGTPLPQFIDDLSKETGRGNIEKLKLTLSTPNFDTKITVFSDAEDSWASARETFLEKLRTAKAQAKNENKENPSLKILIEPFYKMGAAPHSSLDEEEDEFDF